MNWLLILFLLFICGCNDPIGHYAAACKSACDKTGVASYQGSSEERCVCK